jgi:hypothetical protein
LCVSQEDGDLTTPTFRWLRAFSLVAQKDLGSVP